MPKSLRERILAYIEEQERVCAEATPGPWIKSHYRVFSDPAPERDHAGFSEVCWTANNMRTRTAQAKANADYIAAARTHWPLALAALRAVVEWASEDSGALRLIAEKLGVKDGEVERG